MTKKDQILGLLRAHATGDNAMFQRIAAQIAVTYKDGYTRDEIRRLAEREPELPRGASEAWCGAKPAERPWFPLSVGESISEVLDMCRYRTELTLAGIEPVTRVLLSGPPGCGKTMTARWIGVELGMSSYVMQLQGVVDSFMGSTGVKLAKALETVATVPAVWVLDEVDAIAGHRTSDSTSAGREWSTVVNTLCVALDRIGAIPGLLVGTTNRVDVIDPAVLRRFDFVIEWAAPSNGDLADFAAHVGGKWRAGDGYADVFNRAQLEKRRRVLDEARRKGGGSD